MFKEIGITQAALSLLSTPHEIVDVPGAKDLQLTKGEIHFKNVSFHYQPKNKVFHDKSLTISPGQKVGLVGPSGAGKSTFANLIMRLYDLNSGQIMIDGQDISKVSQDSLHRQIAMIPQDPTLFHRSLMENIRYGRLEASDEEVIAASKLAHCHEFIQTLGEGYDTLVGERGLKLSGGQRQRIAIARAILKDAPILILDEATSALDSETEQKIADSLHTLMKGRTTIVIAHRLSTLSNMDRILVFEHGRIIEDGAPAKLAAKNTKFAQLRQLQ